MKRARVPRWTVVVLALLPIALGVAWWLATTGWGPVTRWSHERARAALVGAGFVVEELAIARLTAREAVAGPVRVSAPGIEIAAERVEATLGWKVWRGREEPRLELRGVRVRVDAERWEEARAHFARPAAVPPGEASVVPAMVVRVREAAIEVRVGQTDREVPWHGEFRSSGGGNWRAEIVLTGEMLQGNVRARGDVSARTAHVEWGEGRAEVEAWRPLLGPWPGVTAAAAPWSAAAVAFRFEVSQPAEGAARIAGEVSCDSIAGEWLSRRWSSRAASVEFGGTLDRVRWQARSEFIAVRGAAETVELRNVRLEGSLPVAAADLAIAAEVRAATDDGAVLRGEASGVWTAEGSRWRGAKLVVETGPWQTDEFDAELALHGTKAELTISRVALVAPYPAMLRDLRATVADIAAELPAAEIAGRLVVDPARWLPGTVSAAAEREVEFTGVAVLAGDGRESARLTWREAAPSIAYHWAGGGAQGATEIEGTLTVDRRHAAATAMAKLRDVAVWQGPWRAEWPEVELELRLPRTWWTTFERWADRSWSESWREPVWLAELEAKASAGRIQGPDTQWEEVGLRARSRGREWFETGGGSFGLTATRGVWAGQSWRDVAVQGDIGLLGGALRIAATAGMLGSGPRLTLEQRLELDGTPRAEGAWSIAETDLADLPPWLRDALGDGVELGGRGAMRGRTRWRDGAWAADGSVELRGAEVRWPARGVSVRDIVGEVRLADLVRWRTDGTQRLTFARAQVAGVSFLRGEVEFAIESSDRIAISRLRAETFGGTVEASPFVFDPSSPAVATRLRVRRARLEEIMRLFPASPADAWGVVEGELPVSYAAGRLDWGAGYLMLAPGELGRVRFNTDLRLLTRDGGRSPLLEPTLRRIETAILDLRFDRLRIDVNPSDVPGRSLQVRFVGATDNPDVIAPVEFNLNVNAPLREFIDWSLAADYTIGGRAR